jgi:hypothetical protein
MASGTPPTVGSTENGLEHPEAVSNPVSVATSALSTAAAPQPPIPEQRVEMLLTELEELVPLLPEATLAAVLIRLRAVASSVPVRETVGGDDGSPLRPEQLSYAN